MKKIFKTLALVLVVAIFGCFGMVGCGTTPADETPTTEETTPANPSESEEEETTPSESEEEETTPSESEEGESTADLEEEILTSETISVDDLFEYVQANDSTFENYTFVAEVTAEGSYNSSFSGHVLIINDENDENDTDFQISVDYSMNSGSFELYFYDGKIYAGVGFNDSYSTAGMILGSACYYSMVEESFLYYISSQYLTEENVASVSILKTTTETGVGFVITFENYTVVTYEDEENREEFTISGTITLAYTNGTISSVDINLIEDESSVYATSQLRIQASTDDVEFPDLTDSSSYEEVVESSTESYEEAV